MALALTLGFAADRLLGDPARWHPVAGFGRIAVAIEARAWRPSRSGGALYAACLVGAVAWPAAALDRRLRQRPRLRLGYAVAAVWACLGGRSLERAALDLADAVAADDLGRARRLAPTLMGRDPAALDAAGLLRAAIESVAENTSDAVVATLLWGATLGPAGAVAHRAINTLDAMVGHPSERHAEFGWAAARADDVANWPAARLASAAAAAVALRPAALTIAAREAKDHPSPNAGLVEATFAHVLGIQLGGVIRYAEGRECRPLLGAGPDPVPGDVRRACRLALATQLVALCVAVTMAVALRR